MKRALLAVLFLSLIFFSCLLGFRKSEKPLLITGCARSGTAYIAGVLQSAGLDIQHERMGKDGASSWYLASRPDYRKRRINGSKFSFQHIFHQTRDPLKVISSVYQTEDFHSWKYILKHTPEISFRDPHLVKCAKYWYYWNLKAENLAEWRYRVEDIELVWDELSSRLNQHLSKAEIHKQPKNTNTMGQHPEFTWEDLKRELPKDLYEKITQMATRYGYEAPKPEMTQQTNP